MSVITISRGSYSRGKEVAEKVADKLGYECISRDVILEASKEFNVPEMKLIRAIHDSPSILDRFSHGKERYVSYIKAALLQHLSKDNIVYHGLAGHFFVKEVSHVLKVRILANMNDRIRLEMEREGISEKEARQVLSRDDEQRRKWSQFLYGIDTSDSSLYDLVLHIHKLAVEDAVDIICHTVGLEHLQTTPESKKEMDNLVLAAAVEAALTEAGYDTRVSAADGVVSVKTKAPPIQESQLIREIEELAIKVPGVKVVRTEVHPVSLYSE